MKNFREQNKSNACVIGASRTMILKKLNYCLVRLINCTKYRMFIFILDPVIGADVVEKGAVSCTSSGYVSTVSTPLRTSQTLSASSTDSQDLVEADVGSGSFPSQVTTTTERAIAPAPSAHDNESSLLRKSREFAVIRDIETQLQVLVRRHRC